MMFSAVKISRGFTYVLSITASLLMAMCNPTRANGHLIVNLNPVREVNLAGYAGNQTIRLLGFTNEKSIVFLASNDVLRNKGFVAGYNVRNGRIARLALSKWVYGYFLTLSPNGKVLVTSENPVDPSFVDADPHRIVFISPSTLSIIRMKIKKERDNLRGFLFSPDDVGHIILKLDTTVSSGKSSAYAHPRIEWFNLKSNMIDKVISYGAANELDRLFASPDKKYLLGLFYSETFDPYGESDYIPMRDQLERHGFVDVINPKTGKILWHLAGTDKQPVGDSFFFISPTRFVSSDTLFDIATHKSQHWSAVTPTRKCLAAVPNHPNYALFLTPSGLQLRNWQKNKTLVSWPNIKKPGRILFSPDLKMFSFKRGSLIQFWRFDPKWLR